MCLEVHDLVQSQSKYHALFETQCTLSLMGLGSNHIFVLQEIQSLVQLMFLGISLAKHTYMMDVDDGHR